MKRQASPSSRWRSASRFRIWRLDRDVERRGRLVGDQEPRARGEGPGDADPLPLAAGQLVRVAPASSAAGRPGRGVADPRGPLGPHADRAGGGARPRCARPSSAGSATGDGSWKTMLTSPAERRVAGATERVMSVPSRRTLPAVGSSSRSTQPPERGLAAARLADQPEGLARRRRCRHTPSTARTAAEVLDQSRRPRSAGGCPGHADAPAQRRRVRRSATVRPAGPSGSGAGRRDRHSVVGAAARSGRRTCTRRRRGQRRHPARDLASRASGRPRRAAAPLRAGRGCRGGAAGRRASSTPASLDDPAGVHDHDPVGDVGDDAEIVGDEQHRRCRARSRRSRSRSRIRACTVTSSAVVGSSAIEQPRARRRSPSRSSPAGPCRRRAGADSRWSRRARRRDADQVEQLDRAPVARPRRVRPSVHGAAPRRPAGRR